MTEPTQVPLDLPLTPQTGLALWRKALEEEIGISFPCPPESLNSYKTRLYEWRQESGDSSLDEIMICTPPGIAEIWMVKKTVELEW